MKSKQKTSLNSITITAHITLFSLIAIIISSISVFGYGYQPKEILNYCVGEVTDVYHCRIGTSRPGSSSDGVGIVLKNRENRLVITEHSYNKGQEIIDSIPVRTTGKFWYYKEHYGGNTIVYAEFENGYKIRMHSENAGTIIFVTFVISILLFVSFSIRWYNIY